MSVDIDYADVYRAVARVAATAPSVCAGMTALLDHCASLFPSTVWEPLRHLDYEGDVAALRQWLERILTTEPPPSDVQAFWFGLYAAEDEHEQPTYVLYISGSAKA